MAFFLNTSDIVVGIYRFSNDSPATGLSSQYTEIPHPATNNLITGFQVDNKVWLGNLEQNDLHTIPTRWDPTHLLLDSNFRSGIGDNEDLLLGYIAENTIDFESVWNPRLKHGFYYSGRLENYLFSDDAVTEYLSHSGLISSGGNTHLLKYTPKPGIPIIIDSYVYNRETGEYETSGAFRKKAKFTGLFTEDGQLLAQDGSTIFWENVNTAEKEWIINPDNNKQIITNQQFISLVGTQHVTISGLNQIELDQLDYLGSAQGLLNEEMYLQFSPIDRNQPVKIYSAYQGTTFKVYDVVEDFTVGNIDEVVIDYDLGIVKFGNLEAGGLSPYGSDIYASYHVSPSIQYEPIYLKDYAENESETVNPVNKFQGNSFVFLQTKLQDVGSIVLDSILPEISENFFGPLFMGNNFTSVIATVYSTEGELIEGQEVTFEILGTEIGLFGTNTTTSSISNGIGKARALYTPPRTVNQLGGVTDVMEITASGTNLTFTDYTPITSVDNLYLFQIAREDLIMGIPVSELSDYYVSYLSEQELEGPYITHNLDNTNNAAWALLGGLLEQAVKWEVWHRETHGLAVPRTYNDGDLRTGKRSVVSKFDLDAINPHTGQTPALSVVQPISYTTVSGTLISFEDELPLITPSSLNKSYLIVGPTRVSIQAKTLNRRTNTIIYSNIIDILIDIPNSHKGLFEVDLINSMPSGLLTITPGFDGNTFPVELLDIGTLPLGWRLRSTGITLASALDSLTFLDLNPVPQYYETDLEPSGLHLDLSHQIDVDL